MRVNGLVYRIDEGVYLSLIDPNDDECTDGLPITEGVYETLKDNQISFVDVKITDGTMDIEIDVFDFVNDNKRYNPGDIFYNIKDIQVFSFFEKDSEDVPLTIENLCERGDFPAVAEDIIYQMKENK